MGILGYLGRNARDPHTAGLVLGAGAVVFHLVWLFYLPTLQGLPPWPLTAGAILLVLLVSANAYVTTRVVWWAFVPTDRELSLRRAAAVGLGLGPFKLFTLSAIGLQPLTFQDSILFLRPGLAEGIPGIEILLGPVSFVYTGLVGTIFSLYFTMGIPILITTVGAVGLASLEKQYR